MKGFRCKLWPNSWGKYSFLWDNRARSNSNPGSQEDQFKLYLKWWTGAAQPIRKAHVTNDREGSKAWSRTLQGHSWPAIYTSDHVLRLNPKHILRWSIYKCTHQWRPLVEGIKPFRPDGTVSMHHHKAILRQYTRHTQAVFFWRFTFVSQWGKNSQGFPKCTLIYTHPNPTQVPVEALREPNAAGFLKSANMRDYANAECPFNTTSWSSSKDDT